MEIRVEKPPDPDMFMEYINEDNNSLKFDDGIIRRSNKSADYEEPDELSM